MEEAPDAALPGKASHARSTAPASTVFTIRMICKDEEQSINLPLDQAMIGQLALEAEIRDMRIGELLVALIVEIVKKDLLELLLQQQVSGIVSRLTIAGPTVPCGLWQSEQMIKPSRIGWR